MWAGLHIRVINKSRTPCSSSPTRTRANQPDPARWRRRGISLRQEAAAEEAGGVDKAERGRWAKRALVRRLVVRPAAQRVEEMREGRRVEELEAGRA